MGLRTAISRSGDREKGREAEGCLEAMAEVEWKELWPLRLWVLVIGAINAGAEAEAVPPERIWF